tara:strand:+ start:1018 stop:1380 length:363 start_codon:yes stop_codon:yes gene_type:complete
MDYRKQLKEELNELVKKNEEYMTLSKQLQELREEKNDLEENIMAFMKDNSMDKKIFVLNEHKVQHKSSWQYQSLSMKFLESQLKDYCQQCSVSLNVEHCIQFIKENREKKEKEELKIYSI